MREGAVHLAVSCNGSWIRQLLELTPVLNVGEPLFVIEAAA